MRWRRHYNDERPHSAIGNNRRLFNGMLHVLWVGCPWRDMHERYGKWNSVYVRFRRWAEQGVNQFTWEAKAAQVVQVYGA